MQGFEWPNSGGKGGFYVGLPTAATSNQMVGRMRTLLKLHQFQTQSVSFTVWPGWLTGDNTQSWPKFETEGGALCLELASSSASRLLSSYAVGTVDQAMMSVLLVKYGVLRLLGLAEKTLVIDELPLLRCLYE